MVETRHSAAEGAKGPGPPAARRAAPGLLGAALLCCCLPLPAAEHCRGPDQRLSDRLAAAQLTQPPAMSPRRASLLGLVLPALTPEKCRRSDHFKGSAIW